MLTLSILFLSLFLISAFSVYKKSKKEEFDIANISAFEFFGLNMGGIWTIASILALIIKYLL